MTPEQRRHEIASLLANGLARLRVSGAEQSAKIASEGEFELGFSGNQRKRLFIGRDAFLLEDGVHAADDFPC